MPIISEGVGNWPTDAERAGLSSDFRALFEAAPMPLLVMAPPDFRIVAVNDAYLQATLTTREAITGHKLFDILPDSPGDSGNDGVANLRASLERVVATRQADVMPVQRYPIRRPDGRFEERWWNPANSPILGADGEVTLIIHRVEDVTEHHRAAERLRGAFQIRTVGIMTWGPGFGLVDMNDAFLAMTGFTREEAMGKTWQELTPEEFHPESWKAVEEVLTRGESTPYEKEYFRKDGSRWWGLFAARKVDDEVVEFVLDVTARRRAETELRRLNETLENRVAAEVASRLKIEEALRHSQKMEAIGQLTGGVAHDFNNLLTVIRSSADLLRRAELPEERRRRYVDAIQETADRAAKLTGQLLAFARRQALKPEIFDVAARVAAIADMLRTVVGARIELVTEINCGSCFIEADPSQFETALVNIVVNARDAMDGVGRLTLSVEQTARVPSVRGHSEARGAFVAVSVADTGHGIAPDQLSHIFEPFYTTKEVGKGTGLGLSQVYGFAKQSGGEVDVASRVGEGTTFTLYLPRAEAQAATAASDEAKPEEAACRGHLLIVEDNEQVGAFSTQLLGDFGFETTWARNADAALRLLERNADRYAAVFSDVVMPGMSGVDLGREIRRRWPGLPVVLTSGYSHVLAQESRHGFELVHKPYSVEELTRVLRYAIRQPSTN